MDKEDQLAAKLMQLEKENAVKLRLRSQVWQRKAVLSIPTYNDQLVAPEGCSEVEKLIFEEMQRLVLWDNQLEEGHSA